jgi:hypothetical protein
MKNNGILEWWNGGIMGNKGCTCFICPDPFVAQYSILPVFHHSVLLVMVILKLATRNQKVAIIP